MSKSDYIPFLITAGKKWPRNKKSPTRGWAGLFLFIECVYFASSRTQIATRFQDSSLNMLPIPSPSAVIRSAFTL